ncbi:hypothetical protein ACVIYL_000154 [Bradyrhizobium sp. USDA 3315]
MSALHGAHHTRIQISNDWIDCSPHAGGKRMSSRLVFARRSDYEPLWRFRRLTGNNLGGPFGDKGYRVDSHGFDCEVVVELFARPFQASSGAFWGYITSRGAEVISMGCTLPASSARMCRTRAILRDVGIGAIYVHSDAACARWAGPAKVRDAWPGGHCIVTEQTAAPRSCSCRRRFTMGRHRTGTME